MDIVLKDDISARPLLQTPDQEFIPTLLLRQKRWVPVQCNWIFTGDKRKLAKTPLARNGGNASSENPDHWWSFQEALAEVEKMQARGQPSLLFYAINRADGLVYGDLDGSVVDGLTLNEAWRDVENFTYVERSPSGDGLRWVARGHWHANQEAPDHTRAVHVSGYISLTGHVIVGHDEVTDQQNDIDTFCRHFASVAHEGRDLPPTLPPPSVDTDDLSLSEAARTLLEDNVVPPVGERSSVVQSIANALAGDLGFTPEQVYTVLVNHAGTKQVAMERRRGRTYAALQWLWRVALSSEPARASYVGDWKPHFLTGRSPIGVDVLTGAVPEPPPVLVDGLIPYDVFGWVGAGGMAKTTLMIWTLVHIILGRPIAGRGIHSPGPTLFITAEDDLEMFRYRLRRVCDAMGLTQAEREQVGRHFYLEDVTGQLVRFVESDRAQNLVMTRHVQGLIDAYKQVQPVIVVADPAIFFGPGESRINDSEAALMAVGRRIGAGLGREGRRAAFCWVHHVSQNVAREGIVDQYASRGGTAFADNSRAQIVFSHHTKDHADYPSPGDVRLADMEEGRVLRLHVAKFSYGPRPDQPLWIVRGKGEEAFRFQVFNSPARSEAAAVREATARMAALSDAAVLYDFIEADLRGGTHHTKSSLRDQASRVPGNRSSRRVTAGVSFLLSSGCLVETKTEGGAGRHHYLRPVRRPECPTKDGT